MMRWWICFHSIILWLVFPTYLSIAQVTDYVLADDDPLTVVATSETEITFTYIAHAGETITVLVTSERGTDSSLTMVGAGGFEIFDRDSGRGLDPALLRVTLPATTNYIITLSHDVDGVVLNDTFTISVIQSDVLDPTLEPAQIELGRTFETDRMQFEALPNLRYEITLSLAGNYDNIVYISLQEADEAFVFTEVTMFSVSEIQLIYAPDSNAIGLVTMQLDYFGVVPVDVVVSIEALE